MMQEIETMLVSWLKYRIPTVEGSVYTIRNPWIIFRRSGIVKLSDGSAFAFNKNNKANVLKVVYFALENGIRFAQGENCWKFDEETSVLVTPQRLKFYIDDFNPYVFAETFLQDIHFIDFNLVGKTVVEAGTFIGDTALYYASKGATVYSFEQDGRALELARRNISLNEEYAQKISLFNYAIGPDGEFDFPINKRDMGVLTRYSNIGFTKIRSISVRSLLKELHIENPFLLHLDIKGQEFNVINDDSLANFKRIRIEYSTFLTPSNIEKPDVLSYFLKRLEELGFRKIRTFKHNYLRFDLGQHGIIDAER